jgi:hypothetical protein
MAIVSESVVRRVDTQQPKPAGQGTEVHVQQKPRRPIQGLRPGSHPHVEPVLLPQPTVPGHQHLGHGQVPDLGQGDACTLHEMPHRGGRVVQQVELAAVAGTSGQEEAQSSVDVQPDGAGRHRRLQLRDPRHGDG